MESRKAPTGALAAGSLAGGRPGLAASADWVNAATTRVASNAGRQRDVDEIFKRRHYASTDGILSKIWGGKEMAASGNGPSSVLALPLDENGNMETADLPVSGKTRRKSVLDG
jgi:hypothetical protein